MSKEELERAVPTATGSLSINNTIAVTSNKIGRVARASLDKYCCRENRNIPTFIGRGLIGELTGDDRHLSLGGGQVNGVPSVNRCEITALTQYAGLRYQNSFTGG